MKSMCSLGIAGLPDLPWDFLRQNSRNFLSLHRTTVSGLTRISSDVQSLQILDSNDQNSRSLLLSIGFFDLGFYTVSCCLSTRIRSPATRLNHAKMTRLRDCTTAIMSRIFMPEACSSETHKSNEISWDGVFAEHGTRMPAAWNPSGTPRDFPLSNYIAKLLILLVSRPGIEPGTY